MIILNRRDVAWSEIDGELCIYSYLRNEYTCLNRTGRIVFMGIVDAKGVVNVDELTEILANIYSCSLDVLKKDVYNFIEWLINKQILIRG